MSAEPAVLYEKSGAIAVVTMNRPAVRNAINAEMLCRLADAWQDVNDDPAVRAAIFTGAGEKAFCAGADLDRLVRMMQGLRPAEDESDERIKNDVSLIYKGLMRSYAVSKPIIAAAKGYWAAGGRRPGRSGRRPSSASRPRCPRMPAKGRRPSRRSASPSSKAAEEARALLMLVNLAVIQELSAGHVPDREALAWRDRVFTYADLT